MSKEDVPGSKRSMYGPILTYPGYKGKPFKLCVLKGWDFDFCVRSSPLRHSYQHKRLRHGEVNVFLLP